LSHINGYSVDFERAKLNQAKLENNRFDNETSFAGADLRKAVLKNCLFDSVKFSGVKLDFADAVNCEWIKCNLRSAKLRGINTEENRFIDCDTWGAVGYRVEEED